MCKSNLFKNFLQIFDQVCMASNIIEELGAKTA